MRKIIQVLAAILQNSYLYGFFKGTIYTGKAKSFCVPGLNCYSCPGAVGSCPIGALQSVIGSYKYKLSFYVTGLMVFYGIGFGRVICGWLCPFGLIQELIYKIPSKKIKTNAFLEKLKYLKYLIFIVFVVLMPMFLVNDFGMGNPYFCKLLCPVGTVEAGIPLVLLNKSLQEALGFLYVWKLLLTAFILGSCVLIYRSFCKYMCPLGAFYAIFNKYSFYKIEVDNHTCTSCGACTRVCKMDIEPFKTPNNTECIRCNDCVAVCPEDALKSGFKL